MGGDIDATARQGVYLMAATDNFERALAEVIGIEGGYTDDPNDPGGETKYGITKRDHPLLCIAAITLEDAHAIYRKEYWLAAYDNLSWPLALYVFDCAVNQGSDIAPRLLQKTAGVPQDGLLGQNTLRTINGKDQDELAALFLADRALRYTGTRNFDTYGRGWLKRLFRLAEDA